MGFGTADDVVNPRCGAVAVIRQQVAGCGNKGTRAIGPSATERLTAARHRVGRYSLEENEELEGLRCRRSPPAAADSLSLVGGRASPGTAAAAAAFATNALGLFLHLGR